MVCEHIRSFPVNIACACRKLSVAELADAMDSPNMRDHAVLCPPTWFPRPEMFTRFNDPCAVGVAMDGPQNAAWQYACELVVAQVNGDAVHYFDSLQSPGAATTVPRVGITPESSWETTETDTTLATLQRAWPLLPHCALAAFAGLKV